MKETELAWAAGFYDGEGSAFTTSSEGYHYPRMTASQTHKEPLERFNAAIGNVGNLVGPYMNKGRRKPIYEIRIYGRNSVKIASDLLFPYLCSPKREQILNAIKKADNDTCKSY